MQKAMRLGLILAVVLSAMLAACSNDKSSSTQEPAGTTNSPATETKGEQSPDAGTAVPDNMNAEGLPIVKEPVKLRFAAAQNEQFKPGFAGIEMIERWEKETGIELEWATYPAASWAERKSQIIASGDLPDVFAGGGMVGQHTLTDDEVSTWGRQGLLIPLGELIDKYMPRFKRILEENPEYKEVITSPDGNIYAFPAAADIDFGQKGALFYINRQWLEETGRSLPVRTQNNVEILDHSFTTEEFYELLKDFKRLHPEGIPFSAVTDGQPLGGLYDMYAAFGLKDDANRVIVQDGKVIFTADKPQWVEATKYFYKLYSEGLMDPEYFTQDYATYLAKIAKKPLVVGSALMWTAHQAEPDIYGDGYKNWLLTAPLIGADGQQNWNLRPKSVGRGSFAITAANKYPEITVRFQDYLYAEDNAYQLSMGPFGRNVTKNADGTITMNSKPEDVSDADWRNTFLNTMFITTPAMNAKVKWDDVVQMTIDAGAFIKQYSLKDAKTVMYPNILFNAEDTERLSTLKTDIVEYVKKMQAKWITEGTIDQDWDGYLKELERIGVGEYLEIMQRNYDRLQ